MKVQELIDKLLEIENREADVIMSTDSEGNEYNPLWAVEEDMIYDGAKSNCDVRDPEGWEDEIPRNYKSCIVFYP